MNSLDFCFKHSQRKHFALSKMFLWLRQFVKQIGFFQKRQTGSQNMRRNFMKNKGFIFTFDLLFIVGLFITLFSAPVSDLKTPYFDYSYMNSDKMMSYYFGKNPTDINKDSSFICYNTYKQNPGEEQAQIKEYCYGGYYE